MGMIGTDARASCATMSIRLACRVPSGRWPSSVSSSSMVIEVTMTVPVGAVAKFGRATAQRCALFTTTIRPRPCGTISWQSLVSVSPNSKKGNSPFPNTSDSPQAALSVMVP